MTTNDWTEEHRNEMRYLQVNDPNGNAVCYIAGRGDEYQLRRIIASTPNMLAALKSIVDLAKEHIHGGKRLVPEAVIEFAEPIIAKAEGR